MEKIQNTISLYTNLDSISKVLGIETSILEIMSIKEIKALVEEKNISIVNERVTIENIERYAKFFSKWDLFIDLFGIEIIPYIIKNVNFSEIVTEKFCVGNCYYKNYELLREGIGSYIPPRCRKPRDVVGKYYLVPSDYQGLKHGKIIREFLKSKFPEIFNKLSVAIYEIRDEKAEVYISSKLENGEKTPSVYVPIKSILDRDINKTIERHVSYFSGYNNNYRNPTDENKKVELEKLENMEAFKILKEILA